MKTEDALQTSCAGKGRFPTQQLAAERAKRMRQRKRRERPATVYQCHFCHGWHIGGKRPDTVDGNKAFKRRRQQVKEQQ